MSVKCLLTIESGLWPYIWDAFPYVDPETLHIVMLIVSIYDALLTSLHYKDHLVSKVHTQITLH